MDAAMPAGWSPGVAFSGIVIVYGTTTVSSGPTSTVSWMVNQVPASLDSRSDGSMWKRPFAVRYPSADLSANVAGVLPEFVRARWSSTVWPGSTVRSPQRRPSGPSASAGVTLQVIVSSASRTRPLAGAGPAAAGRAGASAATAAAATARSRRRPRVRAARGRVLRCDAGFTQVLSPYDGGPPASSDRNVGRGGAARRGLLRQRPVEPAAGSRGAGQPMSSKRDSVMVEE